MLTYAGFSLGDIVAQLSGFSLGDIVAQLSGFSLGDIVAQLSLNVITELLPSCHDHELLCNCSAAATTRVIYIVAVISP